MFFKSILSFLIFAGVTEFAAAASVKYDISQKENSPSGCPSLIELEVVSSLQYPGAAALLITKDTGVRIQNSGYGATRYQYCGNGPCVDSDGFNLVTGDYTVVAAYLFHGRYGEWGKHSVAIDDYDRMTVDIDATSSQPTHCFYSLKKAN